METEIIENFKTETEQVSLKDRKKTIRDKITQSLRKVLKEETKKEKIENQTNSNKSDSKNFFLILIGIILSWLLKKLIIG